jgi:hypothetical protein
MDALDRHLALDCPCNYDGRRAGWRSERPNHVVGICGAVQHQRFFPDRIIYLFVQSRRALSFEMYHVLEPKVDV